MQRTRKSQNIVSFVHSQTDYNNLTIEAVYRDHE